MKRHEHYARYDFLMDALWCPGCGRVLITSELLDEIEWRRTRDQFQCAWLG